MIYLITLILIITPFQLKDREIQHKKVDLSGYYAIEGYTDTEKKYDGVAVITKVDSLYAVQWNMGGTSILGVGQWREPHFSVGWYMKEKDKEIRGITVFKMKENDLIGFWCTIPGTGKLNSENLIFIRKLSNDQ